MTLLAQHKINHVAVVIDESGSMDGKQNDVVAVVDGQTRWLAELSKTMNQETRVSLYSFRTASTYGGSNQINCVAFDTDVLRLPSLKGHYRPTGGTPLIDATLKAIEDLERTAQMYGDHAFLVFVITDGMENTSRATGASLAHKLANLPDNWTVGVLVPNFQGQMAAQNYGFAKGNIAVWDVNSATGVAEFGEEIKQSTQSFYESRDAGVRSTKTLFAANVTKAQVSAAGLKPVEPGKFFIFPAVATGNMAIHIPNKTKLKSRPEGIKHVEIKEMVESTGRTYVMGKGFYELVKSEKITGEKEVAVVEIATNKVFTGKQARTLIGLDEYSKRVRPMPVDKLTNKREFDIFVQSTSTNRLLPVGSRVLLFN